MKIPIRGVSYLLGLLLLTLAALVWWLNGATEHPALKAAIEAKKRSIAGSAPPMAAASSPRPRPPAIDPTNLALADSLFKPGTTPERDLEIVEHFIQVYSRAMGASPAGENQDITLAITGGPDPQRPRVFPFNHAAVKNGQLVDRWGSPLWFHSNSSNALEIRSPGPDRELFTKDDVIRNPSPAGQGATAPVKDS